MANSGMPKVHNFRVPRVLIEESAQLLRDLSANKREAVILWAGVLEDDCVSVRRIIVPEFTSTRISFNVALNERISLAKELAKQDELLLAQLHTHPGRAFHSDADDRLALPRHTGAISIVIPCFAATWAGDLTAASVYSHEGRSIWRELSNFEISSMFEVIG